MKSSRVRRAEAWVDGDRNREDARSHEVMVRLRIRPEENPGGWPLPRCRRLRTLRISPSTLHVVQFTTAIGGDRRHDPRATVFK